MDYIKINNKLVPYPNDFNMKKVSNVVSEITTMSGKRIADINGWIYEDQAFKWDTLLNEDLNTLISDTETEFELEFINMHGEAERVRAVRLSLEADKTEFKADGAIVWHDITMEVRFPDAYN